MAPDLSFGSIPRLEGVTLGDKLGEGGFGIVWRGALADGTKVAVKELKVPASGLSAQEREEKFQVRKLCRVTGCVCLCFWVCCCWCCCCC